MAAPDKAQGYLPASINPTVIIATSELAVCNAVPTSVIADPNQIVFFLPQLFPQYEQMNKAGTLAAVRVADIMEMSVAVKIVDPSGARPEPKCRTKAGIARTPPMTVASYPKQTEARERIMTIKPLVPDPCKVA